MTAPPITLPPDWPQDVAPNVASIVRRMDSRALERSLGLTPGGSTNFVRRDRIPAKYDLRFIARANEDGIPLTLLLLAQIRQAQHLAEAPTAA